MVTNSTGGERYPPARPPLGIDPAGLARLIDSAGTEAFAGALMAGIEPVAPADHLAIVKWIPDQAPDVVLSATRAGVNPLAAQRAYVDRFHRFDPVLRLANSGADSAAPVLAYHRSGDIADRAYRDACYLEPGLGERMSMLLACDDALYCLHIYRRAVSQSFTGAELERLRYVAPVLSALARRHADFPGRVSEAAGGGSTDKSAPVSNMDDGVRRLADGLSRREFEVAQRILRGLTSEGIALDLGVSVETVYTYRKRLYGKLGISSANELFHLVVG